MICGKTLLVFSAHAADYVWRAGGTIAKYVQEGADVHVVVMSLGVRGESNDLWKIPGQTEQTVHDTRLKETLAAAKCLGIQHFEVWDYEDYPLRFDPEREERILKKIREVQPDYIITHDANDAMNPDHNDLHKAVHACTVQSCRAGVRIPGTTATRQMGIFGFEPHQTEISGFVPDIFIDITQSFERKVEAMNCFQAQKFMIQIYTERANLRGNHARRLSGNNQIKYAESFAATYPFVTEEFI